MTPELQLPPEVAKYLWRVSPAATAAALSRQEPTPWVPANHLIHLSSLVVNAVTGRGPRFIIVNMPPRHGKSWFISKWTPVWYLENWPHKRVMLCGYGGSFAADWGREVRNTVSAYRDQLHFELSEDSQAVNKWRTNHNGGMVTAGVGGDITGKGANLLIIDDPIKNNEEANSLTIRESIWAWWRGTARTRLEPGGAIVLIMTRWHEDDLVGRLLDPDWNEDYKAWHVVNMPAIWDQTGVCPLGRSSGEALWPARYNEDDLAQIRRAVGPADWEALFQGRPSRTATVGNVYHAYSDKLNVRRCDRDPELPLVFSLDFNVNPMCAVIGQYREVFAPLAYLTNEKLITAEILREIALPDAHTLAACQAFMDRTRDYVSLSRGRPIKLEIFADASGAQRSTNATKTDFQIIKEFFRGRPEFRTTYFFDRDNPAVRDRTNSVNAAFCDSEGTRRLFIDSGCVGLRKDFREVKWAKDSGGNSIGVIDKRDAKLTHYSDSAGYFIHKKFGIRSSSGEQSGFMR